jgi:hypothetical protein
MIFKVGDLVILSESGKKFHRANYINPIQDGQPFLLVENIINEKKVLVRVDNGTKNGVQISISIRHYRLATDSEIKIQKVKNLFIANNHNK